ncbi:MAG: phosphatidylserine decarboxylase [Lachnospiraceae bacterium]|nr:phosphatidylserine decarboxylase [Lachnospiraceae bacterium]
MLDYLYHTKNGRRILKVLTARGVSQAVGRVMDSPLSRPLIPLFVHKTGIRVEDYDCSQVRTFNDFFCRPIRRGKRPFAADPQVLPSPCDGLLSAYRITKDMIIPVKQSRYSLRSLLKSRKLATQYEGGVCLVLRLCVDHYHRYAYVDNGVKGRNVFIPGVLHTVQPVALEAGPVFTQNCREYTVIRTEHFGKMVQMEVGAMLVGKIDNYHGCGAVCRGQEKGRFLYGGSTIILLFEPGKVHIPGRVFRATREGREIPVRMGQKIGYSRVATEKTGRG